MRVIHRITATVLATVGAVLGLLAAASVAAASPVAPNDGDGFPTSVTQPPTGTLQHGREQRFTLVGVRSRRRGWVAVTLLVALVVSRIRQHSAATQLAH